MGSHIKQPFDNNVSCDRMSRITASPSVQSFLSQGFYSPYRFLSSPSRAQNSFSESHDRIMRFFEEKLAHKGDDEKKSRKATGDSLQHFQILERALKDEEGVQFSDGFEGFEEAEEEEDPTSMRKPIYCSKLKAKQTVKFFQSCLSCYAEFLVDYLDIDDICRFKQAFQHLLSKNSLKIINNRILISIWNSDTYNKFYLWDSLIEYSLLQSQHPYQYQHASQINTEYEKSIKMDLDRTFPEHLLFSGGPSQDKLFRVLNALTTSVKEIGYIQGWNQIAGVFLLFPELPEEMVYWIVNHLMHRISLKDLYLSVQGSCLSTSASPQLASHGIQKSSLDDKENDFQGIANFPQDTHSEEVIPPIIKLDYLNFALRVYQKVKMNELYNHIKSSEYTIYTSKWFMVLFSQQLPPEITLCFLAGTILEDWNYMIRMALAIFDILTNEIISEPDQEVIMENLQSISKGQITVTKAQIYTSLCKFEITNDQLLQLKQLFDDSNEESDIDQLIDTIELVNGKFYRVFNKPKREQSQKTQNISTQNQLHKNCSFLDQLGKFLFSSSKDTPTTTEKSEISTTTQEKELKELKYTPLPHGASLDDNRFSEIVHFRKSSSNNCENLLQFSASFSNSNAYHNSIHSNSAVELAKSASFPDQVQNRNNVHNITNAQNSKLTSSFSSLLQKTHPQSQYQQQADSPDSPPFVGSSSNVSKKTEKSQFTIHPFRLISD